MHNKQIATKPESFEEAKHYDKHGKEYWDARELMPLLDYKDWRNFHKVIKKAQESVKKSYQQIEDHFVEINKKITIGTGTKKQARRNIKDYKLTRYACYVIAQNGDSSKRPIALAQSYFAIQTRKQEVHQEETKLLRRVQAREKLKETEKKFSNILKQQGVDSRGIAHIRSAGDETLFGHPTAVMKAKFDIPNDRPLADHLPTITLKAKDLATEMTSHQTHTKNLRGKNTIKTEHIHNNSEIRKLLTSNGIYPEELPPEKDINKLRKDTQKSLSMNDLDRLELEEVTIDIRGIYDRNVLEEIKTIIRSNPGDTQLRIIYGEPSAPKMVRRNINLNKGVYASISEFMVY